MPVITEGEATGLCVQTGAFLTNGHYVGTQGRLKGLGLHMPDYFDARVLVTQPNVIWRLAQGLAARLVAFKVGVVIGMPLGALTLGSDVAKLLGVPYAMAEKTPVGLTVNRPAFINVVNGRRAAIVEDTVNAGSTVREGIKAVRAAGGSPVVIGAVIDINQGRATTTSLGLAFEALISRRVPMMPQEQCLAEGLCSRQVPINRRPGHGHELEQLIATGVVAPDPRYRFV